MAGIINGLLRASTSFVYETLCEKNKRIKK